MLFHEMRRFFTWLTRPQSKMAAALAASSADAPSLFEFDPMWHGDHWQNLLSSPMDARRYVMEDWTITVANDWNEADGAAPAH